MTSRARGLTRRLRAALRGPDAVRRADLRAAQRGHRPADPVPALPGLRAAVAGDAQLLACLAWEWSQQELTTENWPAVLTPGAVDLVVLQAPAGRLSGWDAALARCAELELAVFVWVTGPPGGVAGPAATWVERVDRVFVDDERLLPAWPGAELLPPAVQPRLHNPSAGRPRQRAAAVLGPAVQGVDHGKQDQWESDALPVSGPAVSSYPVVVQLAQQVPWTVLPAAAGGSSVVVSSTDGLPADLRPLVAVADDAETLRAQVTARLWHEELADREGLVLGRAVRTGHAYARRVDALARAAGLPVQRPRRSVSAVVPTNREHELDNVFANVARQAHDPVQLVLVLHGLDPARLDVPARAKAAGIDELTLVEADSSLPLGACMNLGLGASDGEFVAKMDDDNFYGAHYLTDLVGAFDYTDAGIVGKWAHYVWLRSTGAVVLRSARCEHRYERLVQGGSMVLRADVARALRFDDSLPRGVDTDILERARRDGVRTYSADRFNYVSMRGTDRTAHTWT
ncbi:MAG: glycosyltransferase, partial [Thermocrispum sp.]